MKSITSTGMAAMAAMAVAFSPVLLAQQTSGPDQAQNPRGNDSVADQNASATGTSTASSTMDKNDSKTPSSQSIDPNPGTATMGSPADATTKVPSDATTSVVEKPQSGSSSSMQGDSKKSLSDQEFVQRAAQGGMTEVALGQVASDKASSSEVKDFGARMVKDHSQANDELKSIAQKKGIALAPNLDSHHQAQVDKLSKLSGPAFDKAYVSNQVRAHESTVKLFEQEAQSGQDPDLKAFASRTLPTLKDHCSSIMTIQKSDVK